MNYDTGYPVHGRERKHFNIFKYFRLKKDSCGFFRVP